MASRNAIISSAKSIPGGARPTPAPQGTGPYTGQISPLAAQLDAGGAGWGSAYSSYLPRPPKDFTQGAFGPFSPILPVPVDEPEEGGQRPEPRLFQYEVGWNLPVGTPGSEGIKLADFNTLRTLADLYSVARAAIQLRKAEVRSIEWDILPTKEASKVMRGDHEAMRDFGERKAKAVKFFKRPDPDYFSWNTFLDALLEEVLVFDALSLLLRPKWGKGRGKGLLGSDLDSLSLINGPTIRPLLGLHGERPRPPAPAYQQYLYGVPRSDYMTMITERDIEQGGLAGSEFNAFRDNQLLYLPMVPRRWTPYGFPPIERALIPVMAGLQKQGYQLDYFREGTVPAVFVSPGGVNSNMTPNQLRELQDALNAIAGDPAWKHKIIVLPADSRVDPQKHTAIADQFDEIVMNQVLMAFDVQPNELGIMPRVSTVPISGGMQSRMQQASTDIQQRKATKPTLTYIADIMNGILQEVCHQDDMRFTFEGLEEDQDEETKTKTLVAQVSASLRSIDEAREELNLQPWGLPETSDPGWATPTGWIPLSQAIAAHQTGYLSGPILDVPEGTPIITPHPEEIPPGTQGTPKPTQSQSGGSAPAGGPALPGVTTPHQQQIAQALTATQQAAQRRSPGHTAAEGSIRSTSAKSATLSNDRRHPAVSKAATQVYSTLLQVAEAYKRGGLTEPEAVNIGVAALGTGYQTVMSEATKDAASDLDISPLDDANLSGHAALRAENQRVFLMNLFKDLASGTVIVKKLASRLDLYVNSLVGAYNSAYGQTVQASPDTYTMTWNLGPTEHCKSCMDKSGERFTFDTLPGYPGDGAFGDTCEGGPRCGCFLTYEKLGRAYKTRAVDSELEALARHIKKGRDPQTWTPATLPYQLLDQISENLAKGDRPVSAVGFAVEQVRRVDLDGQTYWAPLTFTPNAAGGGAPTPGDGRAIPPGGKPGSEPPRWDPYPGTTAHPEMAGKSASDLYDPNPVEAEHVKNLMRENFPPKALDWVDQAKWIGPVQIPLDRIDWSNEDSWAASHQPKHVKRFVKRIEAGDRPHPAVVVQTKDDNRVKIVDGHHRALAYRKVGKPVVSYVGFVSDNGWEETHSYQLGRGGSSANKSDSDLPVAAGLAVRATNTGRVLMLQRALEDEDPAAGTLEFPGGRLEDGETPLQAAYREWQEETGCKLPDGKVSGGWHAGNGKYQGFVFDVASEDAVDIHEGRDEVTNPDDPDGDHVESILWFDPSHLEDNPAVRLELLNDLPKLREALGVTKASNGWRAHEGDIKPMLDWYRRGAGGRISWGSPGDWQQCVDIAGRHMTAEQAHGFCQLRHMEATGMATATHAARERRGEG